MKPPPLNGQESDLDLILELIQTLISSQNQLVELFDEANKKIARLESLVRGADKSMEVH